ncbi:MAG: FmdE family protein [Ignavibacteria bacterium]|jgi:hypothetical protein
MNIIKISIMPLLLVLTACNQSDSQTTKSESRWNQKYDFINNIPAVTFHYDHGVLAGSYIPGRETTEVRFNDVSSYLGHVCLCGAGGYRISQLTENLLKEDEQLLEKGDFTLISSRDHTVSDVIAFVFGCTRRNDPGKNQYFIDETIETPKREYHYFIGYPPQKKAVHIIYRKHLLIGNEQMDRLWKVELAYDQNPADVSQSDLKLYRDTMVDMVKEVLTGQKEGLFEAKLIDYDEFMSHLNRLKSGDI